MSSDGNAAREGARRTTPLSLACELPETWTMVKVEFTRADGSFGNHLLPTHSNQSVEHILYCLTAYRRAATQHNWNGAALFNKYSETLVGNAVTQWENARAQQGGPNNAANFNGAVRRMIARIAGPQACDNFMDCIRSEKKTHKTPPAELVGRAETLFSCVPWLTRQDGTAAPPVPESEQRKIIFESFPDPWLHDFRISGQNPTQIELNELLEHMQHMHREELQCASGRAQHSQSNHNKGHGQPCKKTQGSYSFNRHRNTRGRGRGRGGRGRGNGGGRGRGQGPHAPNLSLLDQSLPPQQPDEVCRMHRNHLWRKCMFNPRRGADAPTHGSRGRGRGQGHSFCQQPQNSFCHQAGGMPPNPNGGGMPQQPHQGGGMPPNACGYMPPNENYMTWQTQGAGTQPTTQNRDAVSENNQSQMPGRGSSADARWHSHRSCQFRHF